MIGLTDFCLVKPAQNGKKEKKPNQPVSEETVEVHDEQHAGNMMRTFNELRKCRMFTDVILSVSGEEFCCHRAVLVAGSNYFKSMFWNDHKESKGAVSKILKIFWDHQKLAKSIHI